MQWLGPPALCSTKMIKVDTLALFLISRGKNFNILLSNMMLTLAVDLCSFYRLTKLPTTHRVYKLINLVSDPTLQLKCKKSLLVLHEKRATCSSGISNNWTHIFPQDNQHTSAYSWSALCVHLILSPSIRTICVNKRWD